MQLLSAVIHFHVKRFIVLLQSVQNFFQNISYLDMDSGHWCSLTTVLGLIDPFAIRYL